jgi:hypothetical protein
MLNGNNPAGIGSPTTVFVVGSITETVLPPWLAMYTLTVVGFTATPSGLVSTGMVATLKPCFGLLSVTLYIKGNGEFTVRGVSLSELLKVYEEPLPVVAVMLNSPVVGHVTIGEVKLHSTCLLTVRVLGGAAGGGVADMIGFYWFSIVLLWPVKPNAALSLPFICLPSLDCSQPSSL